MDGDLGPNYAVGVRWALRTRSSSWTFRCFDALDALCGIKGACRFLALVVFRYRLKSRPFLWGQSQNSRAVQVSMFFVIPEEVEPSVSALTPQPPAILATS